MWNDPSYWTSQAHAPNAELPAFADVLPQVEAEVSPARFAHIMRVVETAERLARLHDVPLETVRMAALLHDVLRDWPEGRLLRYLEERGLLAQDPSLAEYPGLLHAPAGAAWMAERWPLPGQVVAAVAFHITGHPEMDQVAQTLCVADYTEPGRTFADAARVRVIAQRSLQEAVLAAAEGVMLHLLQGRAQIHPQLLVTRNAFLKYRTAEDDRP